MEANSLSKMSAASLRETEPLLSKWVLMIWICFSLSALTLKLGFQLTLISLHCSDLHYHDCFTHVAIVAILG